MNRLAWLVTVPAVLFVGLVVVAVCTTRYLGPTKTSDAAFRSMAVLKACEAYRNHPNAGDRYPASLAELVHPPWGGSSFLNDPEHDLTDAWGNPFRYAVVLGEDGEAVPYVWAERTVDGRLKLIGAKGRARDGAIFGVE